MAAKTTKYESNPFYIALNGLNNFFNKAQSVAIAAVILSVVGVFGQMVQDTARLVSEANGNADPNPEQFFNGLRGTTSDYIVLAMLIASFMFVAILLSVLVRGVVDYTSAQLGKGREAPLKEALKAVLEHFGSYFWLQIQVFVRIVLWSLLFIVPGVYKSVRYQLAGTVFFAENLHGNAAIARSEKLIDGAWITTFAAHALWNAMTLGVIELVLAPGTNGELYRQFREVEVAKIKKPQTHWLSLVTFWLTVALLAFLFLLLVGGIVAYIAFMNGS